MEPAQDADSPGLTSVLPNFVHTLSPKKKRFIPDDPDTEQSLFSLFFFLHRCFDQLLLHISHLHRCTYSLTPIKAKQYLPTHHFPTSIELCRKLVTTTTTPLLQLIPKSEASWARLQMDFADCPTTTRAIKHISMVQWTRPTTMPYR